MIANKQYMGHMVELDEQSWGCTVTGPEFDNQRYKATFKSLADAKDEIQKRVDEANKIKAQTIKIGLRVIDGKGQLVEIDRINRASSDVQGVEGKVMYPSDVPWIVAALSERNQLSVRLRELNDKLELVEMRVSRGYGRIKAESYPAEVSILQDQYEKKLAKARELADTPVLTLVKGQSVE